MERLTEASGVGIYSEGDRVLVVDLGTVQLYTTIFVLGLVTLICGANGAMMLAGLFGEGQVVVGLVLVALSALSGLGIHKLVKLIRARRSHPEDRVPIVILDLATQQLCASDGRPMAPLSEVRQQRKVQIGSSSRKLVLFGPMGTVLVARGNPFAGGLGNLDGVLAQCGIRSAP